MGLLTFTRKQDVYAYNQNLPNADAAQVKSTNELRDFVAPGLSKKSTPPKPVFEIGKCINTPMQMPNLTRKPMSTVTQSVKRKRMQLSPSMEKDETPYDHPNLVNDIVKNLVPALVLALKEVTKEKVTDNVDTESGKNATDKNTKFWNAKKGT